MKVRANVKNADAKFGFYDTRARYDGEEFTLLKDSDFDPYWMEIVEQEKPELEKKSKKSHHSNAKKDDLDLGL